MPQLNNFFESLKFIFMMDYIALVFYQRCLGELNLIRDAWADLSEKMDTFFSTDLNDFCSNGTMDKFINKTRFYVINNILED